VQLRSNGLVLLAALAASAALCGCADVDFGTQQAWFAKPLDVSGRNAGYTFSELQESKQRQRPITANDLVSSNGACPSPPPATQVVAAAAPAVPTAPTGPLAPGASAPVASATDAAAPAAGTDALLGTAVALGMSECDVVFRAGQPNSVQIGQNPNGDRTAMLTYNAGPRPGIYRFERGQLTEMDAVAPPPAPLKTASKKKPSKSAKTQKKNET
jgi:hypothetical protein